MNDLSLGEFGGVFFPHPTLNEVCAKNIGEETLHLKSDVHSLDKNMRTAELIFMTAAFSETLRMKVTFPSGFVSL